MENKIYSFIMDERSNILDINIREKMNFLKKENNMVEPIVVMPDLSDDGLILSGMYMKTKNVIYPFSPGTDLGCGYRVFYTPLTKKQLKINENNLHCLVKELTNPSHSYLYDWLFSLFWKHDYATLDSFFRFHSINTPFFLNCKREKESNIRRTSLQRAWGTIETGNHFVELREVGNIHNHFIANKIGLKTNHIIGHIHSGAGKEVEYDFERYLGRFIKKFKESHTVLSNNNGYQIYTSLSEPLTQSFIFDAYLSMNFSAFNRSLLVFKLQSWLQNQLVNWFDMFHDGILTEDNQVSSYKGIQQYSNVNGENLAIIPGSIQDVSYLVLQKGSMSLINHGTGEGETGTVPTFDHVLTNLTKPIVRKYNDIKSTIKFCEEIGLVEVVAELKPWICIKKERRD